MISALPLYLRLDKLLLGAAVDTPVQKIAPGQPVTGVIQGKTNEGFKVLVFGRSFQMHLPDHLQVGDAVKFEVIATQPRLTLSLVASSAPLSTIEQIGETSRMIANLADLPRESQVAQPKGSSPIIPAGQPPDPRLLAAALHDTISQSGLFYESHQAQWLAGERSTEQLLKEPQNLLAAQKTGQIPTSTAPVSTETGIAPAQLPIVQQQLHTLEHNYIAWTGQVWDGQRMQWDIQKEPKSPTAEHAEHQWSTSIELALPMLGNICARLVFTGNTLKLNLDVSDDNTAALFSHELSKLKNALAAVNVSLVAAKIEKTET